jgi:type II secretory pathway pseudopilin PulG
MQKYKTQIIKYFIEIVVIIIGILSAFALDTWNVSRNNKILEHKVLTQIHEDLGVTLQDLKNDFIVHKIALKGHFNIDSTIKNNLPYSENFTFDFYWIKEDEYIFPNKTGYNTLESLGTNLISNQEIRTKIAYAYNHYFPRITKGNNLHPDINDFLTPYYKKNFKVNSNPALKYILYLSDNYTINYPRRYEIDGRSHDEFIGFTPIDFQKTMNDEEFKFLLSESKKYRIYKYKKYKDTITHVEELMKLIEKYVGVAKAE